MNLDSRKAINGKAYDLLVIGGGIYGAWMAYCATLRGAKVLLIDKNDYGSGTSSASSKLIHGGLRYLKEKDFKLVKKSLHERKTLQTICPHLISPLDFVFPIYQDSPNPSWKIKIGLILYDILAGRNNLKPHYKLSHSRLESLCPNFEMNDLKNSYVYQDAQIDDAYFTYQIIKEAQNLGADTLSYLEYKSSEYNHSKHQVLLYDRELNEEYNVTSKVIINCTGRWSNTVQNAEETRYKMTKGIHLTLPSIGLDKAFIFTASDDRVFFLLPWYGRTLVGTTDTFFDDPNKHADCSQEDISYLLNSVNRYFKVDFKKEEILSSWAGIRVLKEADGSESSLSRDIEFKENSKAFYTPVGGKITSARADVEKLLDQLKAKGDLEIFTEQSDKRNFSSAPNKLEAWTMSTKAELQSIGFDKECSHELIKRYGTEIQVIKKLSDTKKKLTERILSAVPLTYADLLYQAKESQVFHLDDLMRRRLPLSILCRIDSLNFEKIKETLSEVLDWDELRWENEIQRL